MLLNEYGQLNMFLGNYNKKTQCLQNQLMVLLSMELTSELFLFLIVIKTFTHRCITNAQTQG